MRFADAVDYGDAPTILISGTSSISLVSPGIVQVSLYRRFELPNGTAELRNVLHILHDRVEWLAGHGMFDQARTLIERSAVPLCRAVGAH